MIRRRLVVTGTVQGVFYRAWFMETARALALDGWVRNRRDGSVEAVVQGRRDSVDEMIRLAHTGSSASRVTDVTVSEDESTESLAGLRKRPTL